MSRRHGTLLERLGGTVALDGRTPATGDPRIDSVIAHLRDMLNVCRGNARTLPDYGIADLTGMLRDYPDSIETIRRSIAHTITRYEPRLKDVEVIAESSGTVADEVGQRVRFHIVARLADGNDADTVRFETTVEPTGEITVRH